MARRIAGIERKTNSAGMLLIILPSLLEDSQSILVSSRIAAWRVHLSSSRREFIAHILRSNQETKSEERSLLIRKDGADDLKLETRHICSFRYYNGKYSVRN